MKSQKDSSRSPSLLRQAAAGIPRGHFSFSRGFAGGRLCLDLEVEVHGWWCVEVVCVAGWAALWWWCAGDLEK